MHTLQLQDTDIPQPQLVVSHLQFPPRTRLHLILGHDSNEYQSSLDVKTCLQCPLLPVVSNMEIHQLNISQSMHILAIVLTRKQSKEHLKNDTN